MINPKTPTHFYVGKIEDRSESEIEKWFGLHYAIGDDDKGYTLWCLDVGCWDRPTMHGVYEDFTGVIGRVFENTATTPSHNLNKYLLSGETLKCF